MSKKEKKAILANGVDSEGFTYYYECPKCGKKNPITNERCEDCNKKRPSDAYENAIKEAPAKNDYGMMNSGLYAMPPMGGGYQDPFMSMYAPTFPSMGYDPFSGLNYGAPAAEQAPAAEETKLEKAVPEKKVKGAAIVSLILTVLTLVVLIVPHFLSQDFVQYVQILNGKAGLTIILDTVNEVTGGGALEIMNLLMPAGLVILALFTVLTLITNLFSIKCRKYPIVNRVFAWLAVIGAILMMVMIIINSMGELAYGSVIVSGLVLVTALVTLTGKRK